MATKTIYLPIILETESEISDARAKQLVNTMKSMLDDDFYNRDNMFDNAEEFKISLSDITICKARSFGDITKLV